MLTRLQTFANFHGIGQCVACLCRNDLPLAWCRACLAALPLLPPCNVLSWQPSSRLARSCRYVFSAAYYQATMARLIKAYKDKQQLGLTDSLAWLLTQHLQRCYARYQQPLPQCIVAMPMTSTNWRKRGFHQTGLLSQALAQHLRLPHYRGALKRSYHRQQRQATAQQRWLNTRYAIHSAVRWQQQRVALVDDVITTGASACAAARALKKRGAGSVDVWTLAYTPPLPLPG
ncbi:ComF family protein [Idiomarina xiamenensis]|uniref:Competence protein n=1 Tax=Idiomarina xiamenensis 10-D-4 TaxID=740709 RepID=K2JDL2_9GAMM|nr:phosphoribosyltransferase family protein [Idiomarina xiamenensis]EKE81486.1 competence protein [Idiomarina xiamenensis 10-D-4]